MRITVWPPEEIERRWDEVARYVALAMEHADGDFWLADMYRLLMDGYLTLDVLEDEAGIAAVCGRRVKQTFRSRIVSVELCGGRDMAQWVPDYMQYLVAIARENGCNKLQCEGRRGWSRAMTSMFPGWVREQFVTLVAEVPNAE